MEQRLNRLRKKFRSLGIANFIVTRFENFEYSNMRYLCGYSGSNGVLLVTNRDAFFVTDGRYINQAHEQVKGAKIFFYKGGKTVTDAFLRELRDNPEIRFRGKIGIETKSTSAEFYTGLRKAFPNIEIVETSNVVENISKIKSESEIEATRRAVEVTDKAFAEVLGKIKPGVSEKELAAEIGYYHLKFGAERNSFESIVASGPRGALPHGIASDKIIESGEFITFDIGCYVAGYASDMTRTVALGKVSDEQRKVYNVVLEAQQRAVEAAQPGARCCDLDKIARAVITEAGYGDKFTHSLGHGLGHIVHGLPVLSQRATERLQPGMLITVEPGIYIDGWGGVRIEDDLLITETGHEVLNKSPRELIEL